MAEEGYTDGVNVGSATQSTTPDPLTGAYSASRTGAAASTAASVDSASAGTSQAASDSVTISSKGAQTAQYLAAARVLPPLDEQTIQRLKTAIAHGSYPPPSLIEGLVNLAGEGFSQSGAASE